MPSEDQHAVAITIKPIFRLDCAVVCLQNPVSSSKGAHEHKQSGMREMEVSQEACDDPEVETGQYIEVRGPGARLNLSVARHQELQRSRCRGSDSQDSAAA